MSSHLVPYENLIAYAAGELDSKQSAWIATHVTGCVECATTVIRYKTVRALVRTDDSLEPPLPSIVRAKRIFAAGHAAKSKWQGRDLSWFFNFARRYARTATLAALVAANLLFYGGMVVTAINAQDALPGDSLYGTKIAIEEMRLATSFSSASKVEQHAGSARNRVEEIAALASQGRSNQIPHTVKAFENELDQISFAITTAEKENTNRARVLEQDALVAFSDYLKVLSSLDTLSSREVEDSIQHAIQTTEAKRSTMQQKLLEKPASSPSRTGTPALPPQPTKTPSPSNTPSGKLMNPESAKTPPGQVKTYEPPRTPPGLNKTPESARTPPGQVKTYEPPKTPPGRVKTYEPPKTPPRLNKTPESVKTSPGQVKTPESVKTPPGLNVPPQK